MKNIAYFFIAAIGIVVTLIFGKALLIPFIFALLLWFIVKEIRAGIDKIRFIDIAKKFIKLVNLKDFAKYKKIAPKKIKDITNLSKLVHLKVKTKSI